MAMPFSDVRAFQRDPLTLFRQRADQAEAGLAAAQAQAGRAYVWSARGDLLAVARLPEELWTTAVAFPPCGDLIITEAQRGAVWRADLSSLPTEL